MMTQKKSDRDPVVGEIHRTRRRMAEKFGGDIAAILEDARKRQAASGRPVWRGPAPNKQVRRRETSTPEERQEREGDI